MGSTIFFRSLWWTTSAKIESHPQKFDDKNVEWEVEVEDLHLSSAAHWLLSSGRNLYRRFRSAPNTYTREIAVKFKLSWRTENQPLVATCEFDPPANAGEPFKLQVYNRTNPTVRRDLRSLIEGPNRGQRERDVEVKIQDLLRELI